MRQFGEVEIPQSAFLAALRNLEAITAIRDYRRAITAVDPDHPGSRPHSPAYPRIPTPVQ